MQQPPGSRGPEGLEGVFCMSRLSSVAGLEAARCAERQSGANQGNRARGWRALRHGPMRALQAGQKGQV